MTTPTYHGFTANADRAKPTHHECEICGLTFANADLDPAHPAYACWDCSEATADDWEDFDPVREYGTYHARSGSVVG